MKKLSFRWRLTLMIATLVTVTCLLLTLLISQSAVVQFVAIENDMIEIAPEEGGMVIGFDISTMFPEIAEQLQNSRDTFLRQSLLATAMVVLLVSAVTYFLAGKILSPLRRVTARMEIVSAQNLSEPIEVPVTDDELSQMVRTFNAMLERLDESFARQRQFSANAAHELRTPLAVMQTKLDVFVKSADPQSAEAMQTLREQTERLTRLVNLLLEMTELQTVPRSDRISLHELVEEVFCDLEDIAGEKQITLSQTESDYTVVGSDTLLYRAVYNLVENAIKYGRDGGFVSIDISQKKDSICILVSDTGTGIDPQYWDEIFLPFFRTDKSRSRLMGGAGLGLSLVKEITQLHGGKAKVVQSTNEGTTILMTVPATTD
ncbi:HAMP domain-containing protein [Eubacteriales bacterium OttesenSCG-928-N13]|nr:HAMP domain-containing protein [Eubacteriales bacterium OttesenSCG-928-N13]